MRSAFLMTLLLACLLVTMVLGGCLFGKKGEDGDGDAAAAPGDAAAPGGMPGGGPGGPPGGMPGAGPGGPPGGMPGAPVADETADAGPDMGKVLWRGKYAKRAGDYGQALPLLEQVLADDSQNADALLFKAWMLAEQGNKGQATQTFNAFLAVEDSGSRADEARDALERLAAAPAESTGPPAGMAPGGMPGGPGAPAPGG